MRHSPSPDKDSGEGAKSRVTALMVTMVGLLVTCEVFKQCTNYGVRYDNDGRYPVPQTLHVALLELIKLVLTVVRAKGTDNYDYVHARTAKAIFLPLRSHPGVYGGEPSRVAAVHHPQHHLCVQQQRLLLRADAGRAAHMAHPRLHEDLHLGGGVQSEKA